MQSWVKMCNAALVRVGAKKINGLDEASNEARTCKAILDGCIDEVLVTHPWSSASSRARLALVGISGEGEHPRWPYRYAYATPVNMLRAVRIESGTPWGSPGAACPPVPFRLEMYQGGRVLLCDQKSPDLIYVSKVTDPSALSPELRTALVYLLSKELATTLIESASRRAQFDAEYREALARAQYLDAVQGYETVPPDTTYGMARLANFIPGDF